MRKSAFNAMPGKSGRTTPIIGVTLGDPGGVGPEVIEKGLARLREKETWCEFQTIGGTAGCRPGELSERSAEKALAALNESVALLKERKIWGVINGPIHKANMRSAGFFFPGQTEFYADAFGLGPDEVTMMMAAPKLKVALVTAHLSLKEAISELKESRVMRTVNQTLDVLVKMGVEKPRVAVAGLNPHAGEEGLFGKEEEEILKPAIEKYKRLNPELNLTGPYAPDAIFRQAYEGRYDAVVCMYHDQGLIPFKMTCFDSGVNVTLGLPVWRMSPDHGTAVDIAGKGVASDASFVAACQWMDRLVATDAGLLDSA